MKDFKSLNPYCDGRWSRTRQFMHVVYLTPNVLILIVMEDGLVRAYAKR